MGFLLTNLFVFPNSVFIHQSLSIFSYSVYSPISLHFQILFTHQFLCISEFCLLPNLSIFPNSVYSPSL